MKKFNPHVLITLRRRSLIIILFIFLLFLFQVPDSSSTIREEKKIEEIRGSNSLEAISREWGVPPTYLIESLKLPKDVPLNLTLKELKDRYGFTIEDVRNLVADYQTRGKPSLAPYKSQAKKKGENHEGERKKEDITIPLVLYGIFCLISLLLLNRKKLTDSLAVWILVPSLLIFGVIFQAHPEPMRAIVHLFQSLVLGKYSGQSTLFVFLVFALMTFIGVKLVCGWGCPVGTLQELLYRLPIFKKIKNKKIPFWISNSLRILLFAFFLTLLFGLFFGWKDQSIYRYFNPFRLFEWNFRVTAPIFIILIFGFALINYRPYCLFVCPFGLFSWLIQDLSIFKIRVNKNICFECGKCNRACPSGAAQGIIEEKTLKADCFSCARCLNACPNSILAYK